MSLSRQKKRDEELRRKVDDFRQNLLKEVYGPQGPFWPIKPGYRFAPDRLPGFLNTRYLISKVGNRDKDKSLPDHET